MIILGNFKINADGSVDAGFRIHSIEPKETAPSLNEQVAEDFRKTRQKLKAAVNVRKAARAQAEEGGVR